jgi:hypothetical protein
MRVLNHKLTVALLAAAVLGTAPSAWALGTAAGTSIDNRATITYTVGATSQTPIESSPAGNSNPGATNGADTSFLVDNRVDLTITNQDGANVTVVPSQTGAVTEYLVTNTGNETQDYRLTASNGGAEPYATPPLDSFDVNTPITVFVEDGVNAGYQPAEDTATFIDELVANGTATVYVAADMPGALATNALSVVTLRATTADAGAAGLAETRRRPRVRTTPRPSTWSSATRTATPTRSPMATKRRRARTWCRPPRSRSPRPLR